MKVATAVLVVLLFELFMAWSTYAATMFLAISDAGWLAIPLIITSLFAGITGLITLFVNAKANKSIKQNEEIKTAVAEVKKEQNVLAVKTEQLHTIINSGLTVRLEKEKAIGRFEGKEEQQKFQDAEKKGAQDERARGVAEKEVVTKKTVEENTETPKQIKDVEIKGKMKINPDDIK